MEKTDDAKVTQSVIKPNAIVILHLLVLDQFMGFSGSLGPSHSMRLGSLGSSLLFWLEVLFGVSEFSSPFSRSTSLFVLALPGKTSSFDDELSRRGCDAFVFCSFRVSNLSLLFW